MSTARIPDGTPLGLVQVGLAANGIESTCAYVAMSTIPQAGRSDPPVKPTSEVAHQPGQRPRRCSRCHGICTTTDQCALSVHLKVALDWTTYGYPEITADGQRVWPCGGVQHREIKSAGQTTGGACGGSRLGNPCDEDGLTR